MTFDDYQACLNALFAADRQLNLVQARFAASGAAGATLDAFQLLRLAMPAPWPKLSGRRWHVKRQTAKRFNEVLYSGVTPRWKETSREYQNTPHNRTNPATTSFR